MTDIFFYIFATAALAGALGVVFSRNTVNGAMCLIGTFLSMASLFVLLEAYFLAVIEVLVYAGALMVLAWTSPIPVTTTRCSLMDSVRTRDSRAGYGPCQTAHLGAADSTGTNTGSQGIRMVTRETRTP